MNLLYTNSTPTPTPTPTPGPTPSPVLTPRSVQIRDAALKATGDKQQARTAASLARMEQANRARYDRSARSRDDRGNTYNSRSTLSGRERVGLR